MEEKLTPSKNSINWGSLGILFSMLTIIMCIAALAYGYVILSRTTNSLATAVVNVQSALVNTQQAIEKNQQKTQDSLPSQQAITELYTRLTLLDNLLDNLPLPIPQKPAQVATLDVSSVTTQGDASWWQNAWDNTQKTLNKLVVVRNIGMNELPLTAPEEKFFLYQNLHAQLQSAMWAVMHHNTGIYQNSLERMKTWIQRYFIQDANETKNVLQEIEELQTKTVIAP